MHRRWTIFLQRCVMICRAIAFVLRKIVLRIHRIQLNHEMVSVHLGDDRRRSDRNADAVAANEVANRQTHIELVLPVN